MKTEHYSFAELKASNEALKMAKNPLEGIKALDFPTALMHRQVAGKIIGRRPNQETP